MISSINRTHPSRLEQILIVSVICIAFIHFLTLTISPEVFIDEGWFANRSWSWLKTGIPFELIHQGPLDQFGYPWVINNFIAQLPYSIAFQILGLGLFQARLVSWLFSLVLLYTTARVGQHLYSLKIGLVAALLLALTLPFLRSSRWRQDIFLTAIIMLSFWLALQGLDKNKSWAHFTSGLILGLGFDIHNAAIVFVIPLATLYIVTYGFHIFRKPGTWLVAMGGVLGLGYYVATHMLPSFEVYSRLNTFNFAQGSDAQIPLTDFGLLIQSALREISRYRIRETWFDFAMFAVAVVCLIYQRNLSNARLLAYTIVAFLSFVFLSGNKTFLYAIHIYPFLILAVAVAFIRIIESFTNRQLKRFFQLIFLVYLVFNTSQMFLRIYNSRNYNYYRVTDRIREVIPIDAHVMGMPTWWLGLADYNYRSSLSIPYYRFFNDYTYLHSMELIRPEYLIVDEAQYATLADEAEILLPGLENYRVPRNEFNEFISNHAELVLEFVDPNHGTVAVYRIDW